MIDLLEVTKLEHERDIVMEKIHRKCRIRIYSTHAMPNMGFRRIDIGERWAGIYHKSSYANDEAVIEACGKLINRLLNLQDQIDALIGKGMTKLDE